MRRTAALLVATCTCLLLSTAPVVAGIEDDRAAARRATLKVEDLAGWESARSTGDDPPFPDEPECADLRRAERLAVAREVHGPDFSLDDEATEVEYGLEQTVVVFRSSRVAARYFAESTGPDTIACFEASARSTGDEDEFALEADEITGDRKPALGDDAVGYHFTGRLVGTARFQGDDALPVAFDVVLVLVDRAVTVLSFSTVGSLDEAPGTDELVALAVDRLIDVV